MLTYKQKILPCVLVIMCIGQSTSKVAPDFIKPCRTSDSECLKKTIQETIPLFAQGIPGLGLNSLDPSHQGIVKVELPGGLKVTFINGTITGYKKCKVDSVNYKDMVADVNFHCDLTIKGKYTAAGKILVAYLDGDGDAKIKLPNLGLKVRHIFEDKTKDGIVYRTMKDLKVETSYDGQVSFLFTNLFKGNRELSDAVLTFLNQNWKQLVEEFGKPIENVIIKSASSVIKKFFDTVPRDELFVL